MDKTVVVLIAGVLRELKADELVISLGKLIAAKAEEIKARRIIMEQKAIADRQFDAKVREYLIEQYVDQAIATVRRESAAGKTGVKVS